MPATKHAYNVIYAGTYPDIKHFPIEKRFLWIYLLTCDEHRTEGLFALDVWAASKNCSMDPDDIEAALAEWSKEGRLDFDPTDSMLWLPNALKYYQTRNSNSAKGVLNRSGKSKDHYGILLLGGSAILNEDKFLTDALRPCCNDLVSKGVTIPKEVQARFPAQSAPWK
jgi:hypothetical protein